LNSARRSLKVSSLDEAGDFFGVDDVAAESAGARGGEDPDPAFAVALAFVSAAACRASPASRACTASLVAWRADAISAAAAAALASARFLASIESTGSGVKEYFSASFSFFSFFSSTTGPWASFPVHATTLPSASIRVVFRELENGNRLAASAKLAGLSAKSRGGAAYSSRSRSASLISVPSRKGAISETRCASCSSLSIRAMASASSAISKRDSLDEREPKLCRCKTGSSNPPYPVCICRVASPTRGAGVDAVAGGGGGGAGWISPECDGR